MLEQRAREILDHFYLPDAIYLQNVAYNSLEERCIAGTFVVPISHSYSRQPIAYVTAEQHTRCLSQLSYVLIGFLIQARIPELQFIDFKGFTRLMEQCALWFRKTNLHYRKQVQKGQEFAFEMTLQKMHILGKFAICDLAVNGPVRGKLEFVAPIIQ